MIRLAIGIAVGAAAMWLWLNREKIGFVIEHRNQISAAGRLVNDIGDLFQS